MTKAEPRHKEAAANARMAEYAIAQLLAEFEQRGYERCQSDAVAYIQRSDTADQRFHQLVVDLNEGSHVGASDSVPGGRGKGE